ncbi:calpain-10 [Latimeria chalumnae]|nr:PREDICTED: calpain-10 isoform X1 [Latimeria chalumnae]XP_014344707.1 PREDICTED: calpain-10 isoform X1 [Latimeria chalumnae]|eukprot:XP_005997432.1 PREDICTED: calpain-10 isoform X1 [Latimeria chalumnae]
MASPDGVLFEDPEFPANDSSLFFHHSSPIAKFSGRITWLRPQEICSSPQLFPDNPQEGQAKQGILGDCWFLCACAALHINKRLLTKVISPDQPMWMDSRYTGQFVCQFWQFGQWVSITVDDRLPCIGGRLCFSCCQSEQVFWLPLLEKAYAKLHSCYECLWAGQVADALVDVTGGLAERWMLKSPEKNSKQDGISNVAETVTFQTLMALKDKCGISCSVHGSFHGSSELGEFHAFSVTDIRKVFGVKGEEIRLLQIWNPWGRRSWTGPWKEGGESWSQLDPICAFDLQAQAQQGEFWVEEEEFIREFDEVTAGYPISAAGHLQSLHSGRELSHTQQISGCWVEGHSAGGCRNNNSFFNNPKFWLRVWEEAEVYIALLQKRGKSSNCASSTDVVEDLPRSCHGNGTMVSQEKCCPAIGLHVWKVEKRRFNLQKTLGKPPLAGTRCHSYDREVKLHCDLSPGYYLVIPSTFLKDTEMHFLLRVFSTKRISLSTVKTSQTSPHQSETLPKGEWETTQMKGHWVAGQSAGGSRNFSSYYMNPCFPFSVHMDAGAGNVKIALYQHCQEMSCHPIGFHVYQVPNSSYCTHSASFQHLEPVVSCIPHHYAQEVSRICTLSPGSYIIIPSTYLPNSEGDFTVTIAIKIDRKPVQCQESLEQLLQEVSFMAFMKK